MHVENEAADGRGGETAIIHQLRPIGVAILSRIEPESLEQIESMLRAQAALGKLKPQRLGLVGRRSTSGQRIVEIVEKLKLRLRRQGRVIGDIVGGAHEAIEGEDRTAPLLR